MTARTAANGYVGGEGSAFARLVVRFGPQLRPHALGSTDLEGVTSRRIIVVGGSAGSIAPLILLLAALPPECPAIVFVTVHIPPEAQSFLPRILSEATRLRVAHPANGERFNNATVWLAPPNRHLLVGYDCITLGTGPLEKHCRPAVDVMFRSAALSHGEDVIGVVLSGLQDDGSSGLAAITAGGGLAIVQCPFDARQRSMPESSLARVEVDHCVAGWEMGALLGRLVKTEGIDSSCVD